MFLIQAFGQGALIKVPEQPAASEQLIPFGKFTPSMVRLLDAVEKAGKVPYQYMYDRSKRLEGNRIYYGPTFDGCYWFNGNYDSGDASLYDLHGIVNAASSSIKNGNMPFPTRDLDYLKNDDARKELREYLNPQTAGFRAIDSTFGASGKDFKFGGVSLTPREQKRLLDGEVVTKGNQIFSISKVSRISGASQDRRLLHFKDDMLSIMDAETREIRNHFSKRENILKMASDHELDIIFYLNYLGRQNGAEGSNSVFCAKHFPGGGGEIDATHWETIIRSLTLGELEIFTRPFAYAIGNAEHPLLAIMMNSCSFPVADKELEKTYGAMPSIFPIFAGVPAVYSPYMVKGLLRNKMGFKGLIVSDALPMHATGPFIDENRSRLQPALRDFDTRALMLIAAVYAGVNMPIRTLMDKNAYNQIKKYYESDREFHKALDDLALESLFLKAGLFPEASKKIGIDVGGLSFDDIKRQGALAPEKRKKIDALQSILSQKDAFASKLCAIVPKQDLGEAYPLPDSHPISRLADIVVEDEAWSRSSLLDSMFREAVAKNLGSNSIQWNSIETKSVFAEYLRRLVRGQASFDSSENESGFFRIEPVHPTVVTPIPTNFEKPVHIGQPKQTGTKNHRK